MGTGIWSMHFIGMLSFHLPIKFAFDLPITLLSLSREKIPRAMIAAATQQDQENAAMVRAINGLARELSIEVMAQGVENEARRDLLSGVPSTTKVQGFYYSALLPASGATDLLRQGLIEPRLSEVSGEAAAH
jgi:predicted signal transduction protein with EAL and GGDEF domain